MDSEPVRRIDMEKMVILGFPAIIPTPKGEPSLIGDVHFRMGLPYDSSVMIEDYDGRKVPYSPIKHNMLDMYQLGFNTNTNVSVRGGNENIIL